MNARNENGRRWRDVVLDYTPYANRNKGLREWWLSPPRTGIYRVVAPWEFRHLRFFGGLRVGAGFFQAAVGLLCLAFSAPGWGAFFLVIAVLNVAGGGWFFSIDRSVSASA